MHFSSLVVLALVTAAGSQTEEPKAGVPNAATAPIAAEDAPANAEEDAAEDEAVDEELQALREAEAAATERGELTAAAAAGGAPSIIDFAALPMGSPLRALQASRWSSPGWSEHPRLGDVSDASVFDVAAIRNTYDIPVDLQPEVAEYIRFFQGPGRRFFIHWLSRSTRYASSMQRILEAEGVPRDTLYLAMIESGFSAKAYSHAHASGPWQFIAPTGKHFGLKQDFWVDERRDPTKSTVAAAKFLRQLHGQLGHWYLAWAGYNTGAGRVRRTISRHGSEDFWMLARQNEGLASETKHYVPKLLAAAILSKHYEAFGFKAEEFQFQEPEETETLALPFAVDLDVLAQSANITPEALRDLNPELKRWCTPPASAQSPYFVRVPRGAAGNASAILLALPAQDRLSFVVHRVRSGETLSAIAASHGSAAEAVMRMNGLKDVRRLRVGAELVVPVAPRGASPEIAARVVERQSVRARRAGFIPRPHDEVPAGTRSRPAVSGLAKREFVEGKVRVTYGVSEGDTLWAIGNRFDCSVEDIRKWNGLGKRSRGLSVGKALVLWPGKRFEVASR